MKEKVLETIDKVLNPATGKTLKEEGRLVDVAVDGDSVIVTYKRDGISPEMKRKIEDSVFDSLEGIVNEDNITVKTVSADSTDVYKAAGEAPKKEAPKQQEQAQVKAGHGPTGFQKKRVPGVKKVLAVHSAKGGVGKSTVSVNLALSLSRLGLKVGILDADVHGPSVPMLMGQRAAKPTADEDKKILPIEAHGIKFISFGLFIGESDPVIWRGPMLGGVLNQFLFDVNWGDLDILIMDLPPGTGDVQLTLIQNTELDAILGVSTPQDVALLDSKKGIGMFNTVKLPILGLVENMSYFVPEDMPEKKYYIFGNGGVEKAAKELELDFLGEIPLEIALREGSDSGVPYMSQDQFSERPVWKSYMSIAEKVATFFNLKPEEKAGFFSKIFKK